MLLSLYSWIVIIAALLSFVNPDPNNQIVRVLRDLTEPLFAYVRRKLPFVVYNGIDFAPLLILIAINIIISILQGLMI
jgi:YggT family protein